MKNAIIKFLATGAYSGLLPKMPGTFGTVVGIPVAYIFSGFTPMAGAAVLITGFFISSYVSGEAEKMLGGKDPSSVVIDEILGYMVAAYLIPLTALNIILIFLLFRFFDILKPFPIGLLDRKIHGGKGIVLDDVIAGIFANISVRIIIYIIAVYGGGA